MPDLKFRTDFAGWAQPKAPTDPNSDWWSRAYPWSLLGSDQHEAGRHMRAWTKPLTSPVLGPPARSETLARNLLGEEVAVRWLGWWPEMPVVEAGLSDEPEEEGP